MGFAMFSSSTTPIVLNFGSSSVKALQATKGSHPTIVAAAEMPIPDSCRLNPDRLFPFFAEHLPRILEEGGFKGRKVTVSLPAAQTLTQHMQVAKVEGLPFNELVLGQLQAQTGCMPGGVVVRSVEVGPVNRNGQALTEAICFAITRETVLRYIDLLTRLKLKPVGIHTETMALVRAFQHLGRRKADADTTTMFVDLGWSGTHIALAHGQDIVFARSIQVGGQHFDQVIASALGVDMLTARQYRIDRAGALPDPPEPRVAAAAEAGDDMALVGTNDGPKAKAGSKGAAVAEERRSRDLPVEISRTFQGLPEFPEGVDFTEQLETITDELSMCLRYHRGLFPERKIDRAILLGGEARQTWLCQYIVRELELRGQLGDPLARLKCEASSTPGVDLGQPQPGWAVACGLLSAPTDL